MFLHFTSQRFLLKDNVIIKLMKMLIYQRFDIEKDLNFSL